MIIGVGIDLCRIDRIRRSVDRFGKEWLDEVFTNEEQVQLGSGEQLVQEATIGFALKEACSKMIGTGFARGVRRQDFVVTLGRMACSIRMTGAAKRRAAKLCGASAPGQVQIHVQSTTRWVTALAILQSTSQGIPISSFNYLAPLPEYLP